MKSYTDLEQSKKLAEILPLESADMLFHLGENKYADSIRVPLTKEHWEQMMPAINPCWSLAALLDVLPQGEYKDTDLCCGGYKGDKYIPEWFCSYEQKEPIIIEICHADNPVDAVFVMIIKLHEQKLL